MYHMTRFFLKILLFFFFFNFVRFFSFSNFLYFNLLFMLFMFYHFLLLFFFPFIHGGIQALIRGIGKLSRQRQKQRIIEIVVAPIVPFNIFTNVKYNCVKIMGDETTL